MFPALVALIPLHATPPDPPPPLTPSRLLTEWTFEWWLMLALAIPAAFYVWGLVVLRRRGDHWSVGRSVAFLAGGIGSAVIATMSGIGTYDTVLFSVHMVQHTILMMITPLFLALGAPLTLALRTVPGRPRRALLGVLHSRFARVVSFPPLALALFIATPFALYYSPFYEMSLESAFWHAFVHAHFVIVGSMLMWPLVGTDPIPGRVSYPLRLLLVFLMLPFHAFLGVTIMDSSVLLAGQWYESFHRNWGPTPLEDQQIGGGIMWVAGDVIAVILLVALLIQWFAHSQREARREDRRLDRLEAQAALAANRGGKVEPPG